MTSFYTSSPTVGIPAQPVPDQYFHAGHYRPFQPKSSNDVLFNQTPGSIASFPPTPSSGCIAGRKRSRGDTDDDADEETPRTVSIAPPPAPKGEPVYGPGMTLIYPNDNCGHYTMDATSQTGTWVDEAAKQDIETSDRPVMRNRKSQRTSARAFETTSSSSLPAASPHSTADEPIIDRVTRMLGISWVRLDRNEGGQINQRAYTRWIERHYPSLANVELWFENSSIPGYLGTAMNHASGTLEYLLWSFDLKQAVLVTRDSSELMTKLGLGNPSDLIKSAPMSIFANSEPSTIDEKAAGVAGVITPPPDVLSVAPSAGDMEIDC